MASHVEHIEEETLGFFECLKNPEFREEVHKRVHRFLAMPLALASVTMVLLVFIQFTNRVSGTSKFQISVLAWALWAFIALHFLFQVFMAAHRVRFLRRHWINAVVVIVPVFSFAAVLRLVQLRGVFTVLKLTVAGGR